MAITKINSLGVNLTSPVEFSDGTASLPALTNSGDTNTGVFFSAADTIDFTEGGAATGQFDSSGNFKFNSGYGSVATAFGCRAWVNFNGTGTVAINASGNVTSITDNGTGDYTVNFTNALTDANYALSGMGTDNSNAEISILSTGGGNAPTLKSTTAVRIVTSQGSSIIADLFDINVIVIR